MKHENGGTVSGRRLRQQRLALDIGGAAVLFAVGIVVFALLRQLVTWLTT